MKKDNVLSLIYYQGNQNFGVIGKKTTYIVDNRHVCIGDIIRYVYNDKESKDVVIQVGAQVLVFGNFLKISEVEILSIYKSHSLLKEGDALNNLRLKVMRVDGYKDTSIDMTVKQFVMPLDAGQLIEIYDENKDETVLKSCSEIFGTDFKLDRVIKEFCVEENIIKIILEEVV